MLSKRKLKDRVRVTFTLPAQDSDETACLVGDFNRWDQRATPMARNKGGDWEAKLDLDPDREYQFRYLANEDAWRNDPDADGYARNPYGSQNCIVSTAVTARPRRGSRKKPA